MLRITVKQFCESLTKEDDSVFCDIFNSLSNDDLELSRQLAEKIINIIKDEGEKYDPTMWILSMAFCTDMMFEYMKAVTGGVSS